MNKTVGSILKNMLIAAVSLFLNGLGVYLTIHAGIGAGPWDVFNLGLSKTFGMLYGTASITVSLCVLIIDVILREPIGIAMIIDAVVVGKSVDLFNYLDLIPAPDSVWVGILMAVVGLFILGYTQFFYMKASLGCGPRDTLLVGLKRRCKKIPIGVVSIAILAVVTVSGWLLGGQVGIGTFIFAFGAGPVMQLCFHTVRFDATQIRHQPIQNTIVIFAHALKGKKQ